MIPLVTSLEKVSHSHLIRAFLEWIPKQSFPQSHEKHSNMIEMLYLYYSIVFQCVYK